MDPLTRRVRADLADVAEIQQLLDRADRVVGHNLKFDVRMLAAVGVRVDWAKTDDTIVAVHAVDSSALKDLTRVVWEHLGVDIRPHEDGMREAVLAARRVVQQARLRVARYGPGEHTELCDWMIAQDGLVDADDNQVMPGDNKEHWRADGWLPHALTTSGFGSDYRAVYPTAADRLREYGGCDTMATYKLWVVLEKKLRSRGLWDLYRFQMKLPEISARMEDRGIGVIPEQVIGLTREYREEAERLEQVMLGVADQYDYPLVVPKGTKSKSLDTFLFDPKYLNLPVVKRTDKGNPSFDADARERYEDELPRGKLPHLFVSSVERRQVLTKAVGTLEGYSRFMIKTPDGRWVMHSNLNQTGTRTLQWSSNNPNQQNCSKQGRANLRRTFGPGPGRVWYSLDAQNIQLRVPAYECDERDLVEVFDHPERGPYYGSYHLVIFDVVHPDLFSRHGKECKTLFEDTHYQWVKNANFARQFGAQQKKVDATFRVKGAYQKIAKRFPKIDRLNRHYVDMAVKRGYVETIPDRDIDPKRGYPLQVPRNEWDGVEPTKPFCYHVAGTAQLWMRKAMVRCEEQLVGWRAGGLDAWMIAQVHDELVFDVPHLGHPVARIISGGQIGADQGGLQVAKAYGVPTGGYIGKGYKTLLGSDPSLSKYGLRETGTDHYPERTHMNVAGSNGTIRFATDFNSPGERCTMNAIRQYNKPHYDVDLNSPPPVEGVCRWIRDNEVVILNVAGNAGDVADKGKKVADKVYGYLARVLTALDPLTPHIFSLKNILERCGDGIGIPTPCSVERHSENWAKSVVIG